MVKETEHCCKLMNQFTKEKGVPINYNPILREYSLDLGYPEIQLINFCPWCSSKLPTSLRDEFFDILEKEYEIHDSIFEILKNKHLPSEFKSDTWWKIRKL